MIAPNELYPPRLRLGDQPEDLARGRLLFDLQSARGTPPRLVLPRKGSVPIETELDGRPALELLVAGAVERSIASTGKGWLLDLAAHAEGIASPGEADRSALPAALLDDIVILLAASRRSAAHDLGYAFRVLAGEPGEIRRDRRLTTFREEVNRAVGPAMRSAPRFAWRIALILFRSAESVEEIVAARWRRQLGRHVVLAANSAYADGRVVYAYRTAADLDAGGIVASGLPAGAPPPRGARDAGRGAMKTADFSRLLRKLRFRDAGKILSA